VRGDKLEERGVAVVDDGEDIEEDLEEEDEDDDKPSPDEGEHVGLET